MLRTYCSITGYEIVRADAFSQYKTKKILPTEHPIFAWSTNHLYNFLRNNFIKREHQVERVLVIHAICRGVRRSKLPCAHADGH